MAIRIAKLVADLVANTSQFDQGMNKSSGLLGRVQKSMSGSLKGIDTSFKGMGEAAGEFVAALVGVEGGIAAVASGAGLALLIKGATDSASAIQDQADSLQISTDAFQEYTYAANQSGLSQEEFVSGITKLNAKIADGSLKYKDASEALLSIAEATKNAKDGTEKLAIANDAFGAKTGAKFIPLLNEGAEGLKALADEAQRTGAVLSGQTIQAAKQFSDELESIGSVLKANFQQGFLDQFVGQGKSLKAAFTDPAFTQGLKDFGTLVGDIASAALKAAAAIGEFTAAVGKLTKTGSNGIDEKFFRALNKLNPADKQDAGNAALRAKYNTFDYGVKFGPTATPQASSVKPYVSSDQTKALDKQKEAVDDLFDSLDEQNEILKTQTDLYGQNKGAIDSATKAIQIKYQLQKQGITLSKDDQEALQDELDTYQQLIDKQKEQADATEEQKKAEEAHRQAWETLKTSFGSAFEEAIQGGKKFSDVLADLLGDIEKLALKMYVTGPLLSLLFGSNPGEKNNTGGLLTTIGSAIFGGFGSHAAGTSYINRDGLARVHKGEEIVNRRDVERPQGMEVSIYNNNPDNQVSSSPSSDGEGIDVVIDRVAGKKLSKRGSAMNSAMRQQLGQTLIRR